MTRFLIFRIQAEKDLAGIKEYYDEIAVRLSDEFFLEIFRKLRIIENYPKLYQVRYRGIRIAPLYHFPYGIHYRESSEEIVIYRVLHTKRFFK